MSARALEAVERILDGGGDSDDVLRAVVATLADEPDIAWAGIRFLERGTLVQGPEAGSPDESRRGRTRVVYQGDPVGELAVDGGLERACRERVAELIAAHVLLGWDTGGEAWEP